MDRFKFRAWCKKRKRMYEVLHLHKDDFGAIWATVKGFDIIDQKDIHIQVQPKDCVAMQCTGLTDKNGKDIFEGDIIEFIVSLTGDKKICIIEWIGASFIASLISNKTYSWNLWWVAEQEKNLNIIGNIYEKGEG